MKSNSDLIKNPTEIEWVQTRKRRDSRFTSGTGCSIAIYNKKEKQLCITIHEDMMKICRLYVGDKVRLGRDANFIYIKRDDNGNYRLSMRNAKKGDSEKYKGTHNASTIKSLTINTAGIQEKDIPVSDLIAYDDRYTLIIPLH